MYSEFSRAFSAACAWKKTLMIALRVNKYSILFFYGGGGKETKDMSCKAQKGYKELKGTLELGDN